MKRVFLFLLLFASSVNAQTMLDIPNDAVVTYDVGNTRWEFPALQSPTLRLEGATSGYTELDSPATAGSFTLTLPSSDGNAGETWTTDASGNLTFGTLGVAGGGTGATTLTDGGVLLGSGSGAVTAMSVLADGEFIVGDGTTDPVAESGNVARTSLGLGTSNSPVFEGSYIGGGSVDDRYKVLISGTHTQGSGSSSAMQRITGNLEPLANSSGFGLTVAGGTVTAADSGTHSNFSAFDVSPLVINNPSGTTIDVASTVYISGQATGATENYALWVGGTTLIDGIVRGPTNTVDRLDLNSGGDGNVHLRATRDLIHRINAAGNQSGTAHIWQSSSGTELARLDAAGAFTLGNTGLHLLDTDASHDLIVKPGSDLLADRTLTIATGDADRTLSVLGDATVDQDVSTTGSPTHADLTLTNPLPIASGGTNAATASAARTGLGLAIGSDVQAFDGDLDALSGLAGTGLVSRTAANTYAERTITGTANQVVVADGDGVSGNPTLSLPQDIHTGASPEFNTLELNRSAGSARDIRFTTDGTFRWFIRANTASESGSNAGSDLEVIRRADDGGFLGTALKVVRSSGRVGINRTSPGAMLHAQSINSTTITQIVQGAASQSEPLTEWQDSSGNVLASVDENGNIVQNVPNGKFYQANIAGAEVLGITGTLTGTDRSTFSVRGTDVLTLDQTGVVDFAADHASDPSDTGTIVDWLEIKMAGTQYWLPLYQ